MAIFELRKNPAFGLTAAPSVISDSVQLPEQA
jgi:hypothetical protein